MTARRAVLVVELELDDTADLDTLPQAWQDALAARPDTPGARPIHVHGAIREDAAAVLAVFGDDRSQVSDGYHTFAELYAHRRALTAALTRCLGPRAWRSRLHHDGTMFPGMFIVGAELRGVGQVSYHYELEHWDDFADVAERPTAPEFDGHTPDDVVERLLLWAGKAVTR
jgi:hypothetical protein